MIKNKKIKYYLCSFLLLTVNLLAACNNGLNNSSSENTSNNQSIVILYENDVHCNIEGYSKLASLKNELKKSNDYVGVVSSGDFVQGGTIGAVSKGEYIVNWMNKVGYDAIALGNHEFDFGLR